MQRTDLFETLEGRQLYSVVTGRIGGIAVDPTDSNVTINLTRLAVPTLPSTDTSGVVNPGEAVGFDPQPDPPATAVFSTVRV
jgi:hypothetical protein